MSDRTKQDTNRDKKWHYSLTVVANIDGVSDERLLNLMTMYKNPFYVNSMKVLEELSIKYHEGNPILQWQKVKSKEIDDKWHNNIKYTIDADIVSMSIDFDVYLPCDWKKGDVLDWCGGANRLAVIHPMIEMEMLTNSITIPHDYNAERIFLKRLLKNQVIVVSK